jgi:exonuclease SbcD
MKILHTSDWHIGKTLYGKQRYSEFEKFIDWILNFIDSREIDILIISGDIFDTTTPSNRAQALYYSFLNRLRSTHCIKTIITAGNHDSPTFLRASKPILKGLDIEVISDIDSIVENQIFKIDKGDESVIVCGVPYLRDRDIRKYEVDESSDDKISRYSEGIKNHYDTIISKAKSIYEIQDKTIPIVATGHLFTAGSSRIEGDGVRDLYVGSVSYFDSTLFPSEIDYLALGHIHQPQIVGKNEKFRFSGSPLPINFGEKFNRNIVIEVEFKEGDQTIVEHDVPRFQELLKIVGDYETICEKIDSVKDSQSAIWIEVEYNGKEVKSDLKQLLLERVESTNLEILKISDKTVIKSLTQDVVDIDLEDITHQDLFETLLDSADVEIEQREDLISSFNEIVTMVLEEDSNEDC